MKFYEKIFNWEYLINMGYMDIQRIRGDYPEDISNILSGKVDVFYYDFMNFSDLVNNNNALEFIRETKFSCIDTIPILFSIPKNNGTRRILKFPNLYSYMNVLSFIIKNKSMVINALEKDKESTSKYFNRAPYRFQVTDNIKEQLLFGKTKFYKTDFTSFYHSLYTHTIPWLVMGKQKAKADKKNGLSNKLDHLIRNEQSGETHGIPTGNLPSRIIIEYIMSFFDSELKVLFNTGEYNDITFNRYVDDFIFGYNDPNSLITIKKALIQLTTKYDFHINSTKSKSISYLELSHQTNLLNYFDEHPITSKSNVKETGIIIKRYIKMSIDEERAGIKGASKLLFTGLRYLIENNKHRLSVIKNILLSLIGYNNIYDSEVTLLQQLVEKVILDSRLTIYFMQLLDVLYKSEKALLIDNLIEKRLFTEYMRKFLVDYQEEAEQHIIRNLVAFKNQEAYFLILLYKRCKVPFNIKFCIKFFKVCQKNIDICDDFSYLIILDTYLEQLSMDSEALLVIEQFDTLLRKCTNNLVDPFIQEHWLLRYELLRQYKENRTFKKMVLIFYRHENRKNGSRPLDLQNLENYLCKNRVMVNNKPVKHEVFDFYRKLLKLKIHFSKL